MTHSGIHLSTPVAAGMSSPARIPLLVGAALLAAALLVAPSWAEASTRDGHRDVVIVTSVNHPPYSNRHANRHANRHGYRYGSRHGHSSDRHYYIQAEPPRQVERARRYASQATAQASTAWRLGCARSGPRWSTDWNDHYFWALDARPRHLQRELDRREDHLQECQAWNRHHNRHSNRHYRHH